jgi:hypothetical protein
VEKSYRYWSAFRSPKEVVMGPANPLEDKFLKKKRGMQNS